MWGKTHPWSQVIAFLIAFFALSGIFTAAYAQDPEPDPEEVEQVEETEEIVLPEMPQLYILGSDVTNPPTIVLNVYGRDAEGRAIDFATEAFTLTSDGTAVVPSATETYPVGTFTLFLIDIPTGVEAQLPAIQDAIKQFASPGSGMQEQIDYVAIYQVGESSAGQLLAPDNFYNSVQNFFVDDLAPETEATALIDSIVSVLDQIEQVNPNSEMAASVVVMSDGTDVVSTLNEPSDIISRTTKLNMPIHTIWVDSTDLTFDGQQAGQAFLQEISDSSYGVATKLDDSEGLSEIWQHIAGFRERARIRYVIDELTGGAFDVELNLDSDPSVKASLLVEMPENQPQISLIMPTESNTITLPNLEEPVPIRLGANVSWLDGLEREISAVKILVNGREVGEVPVEEIDDFTFDLTNLSYGPNTIELLVLDSQGLEATNPPAIINVLEGDEDIPNEFQPGPDWGTIILDIFLILVVVGAIAGIILWIRRSGKLPTLFPKGRSKRSQSGVTYETGEPPLEAAAAMQDYGETIIYASLEVVESITEMPKRLDLAGPVIRIGRTPDLCDIAFREDLTVSRQHANMMLEGKDYRIFDEGSTSGTWVNGRQVPDYGVELADGDEIHLGAVHLIYRHAE